MKYKKITITMPEYLVNELEKRTKKGEKSKYIATAVQKWMVREKFEANSEKDTIGEIMQLRKVLPKYSTTELNSLLKSDRK